MTTFAFILVLTASLTLLIRYARNDRFAGNSLRVDLPDELGPVELRRHLVPRPAVTASH